MVWVLTAAATHQSQRALAVLLAVSTPHLAGLGPVLVVAAALVPLLPLQALLLRHRATALPAVPQALVLLLLLRV